MKKNKYQAFSEFFSGASLVCILIALFGGLALIRVGAQDLMSVDTVDMDFEQFSQNAVEVTGTIKSMDVVNRTVVTFSTDEKECEVTADIYNDQYKVGDEIKVYYNPDNPDEMRIPDVFRSYYKKSGSVMLKYGFIVFGASAALAVLFLVLAKKLRKKGLLPNKEN